MRFSVLRTLKTIPAMLVRHAGSVVSAALVALAVAAVIAWVTPGWAALVVSVIIVSAAAAFVVLAHRCRADSSAGAPKQRPAVVGVAAVVVAVLSGVAFWGASTSGAHDSADGERIAQQAAADAADVLSYRWVKVSDAASDARKKLTGGFLSYYDDYAIKDLIPKATQGQLRVEWNVQGSSLESIADRQAQVLAFLKGTVTSGTAGTSDDMVSAVRLSLRQRGDRWLIEDLVPL